MNRQTPLAGLLFFSASFLIAQDIHEIDFKKFLTSTYKLTEFESDVKPAVEINKIQYFDVDRDGRLEALVLASTCYTGSAGPDIAAVYKLLSSGELVDIFNQEVPTIYNGERIFPNSGNWSQYISYKNNYFIVTKCDRYGVAGEIQFFYRWITNKFKLIKIKKNPA